MFINVGGLRGFNIAKGYLDQWYFRRPDGLAVPHCGYRPEDSLDDDIEANYSTLDKNPSREGLPALPFIVAERAPPAYLM